MRGCCGGTCTDGRCYSEIGSFSRVAVVLIVFCVGLTRVEPAVQIISPVKTRSSSTETSLSCLTAQLTLLQPLMGKIPMA
ncbi:hypothetical protein OS493_000850 [Desmophyllum pertusum]|uniref:Uncharacterized protein n=1 Tax=Desmophyllum pertusum TaxID=174260 RepID=A0A9W9ZWY8_9CNID|nr:hypothetical protein OS493_000850 [Desmophyllum pertusum]